MQTRNVEIFTNSNKILCRIHEFQAAMFYKKADVSFEIHNVS